MFVCYINLYVFYYINIFCVIQIHYKLEYPDLTLNSYNS